MLTLVQRTMVCPILPKNVIAHSAYTSMLWTSAFVKNICGNNLFNICLLVLTHAQAKLQIVRSLCTWGEAASPHAQLCLSLMDQESVDQGIQRMRQAEPVCRSMVCCIHWHTEADLACLGAPRAQVYSQHNTITIGKLSGMNVAKIKKKFLENFR